MKIAGLMVGCVVGACVVAGSAWAGGIYVPGAGGPQAQGRAGAFAAKADDPSAIFHNPAGFAKGTGTIILIGANFLDYDLTFARAGSYETPTVDAGGAPQPYLPVTDQSSPAVGVGGFQAVPIIAVTTDFGFNLPGIRFGLGLFAPNGFPERRLNADYDFEDPTRNAPPNRYDIIEQDVSAAFPSVGAAWSYSGPIEVDVGFRVTWGFAGLKAKNYVWGIRNYEEDVGVDGVFNVDVADHFVPSAGVGVLLRPDPTLEIGLAYSSPSAIRATGEGNSVLGSRSDELGLGIAVIPESDARALTCQQEIGGSPAALNACVDVTLPQTATIAGRYIFRGNRGREVGDIELDVKWEDWSAGSNLDVRIDAETDPVGLDIRDSIVPHGFRDTISIRLGGAYSFPLGGGRLIVRGGAAYDTAAAPTRWQRTDMDGAAKTTLAAGLAYEMSRVRIAVAGGGVIQPDRTVPECNPTVDDPGPACIAGGDVPSPVQPTDFSNAQTASPFNAGDYSSSYKIFSLGVTTWF